MHSPIKIIITMVIIKMTICCEYDRNNYGNVWALLFYRLCCFALITFAATDVINVVGPADKGAYNRNVGFVVGIRHGRIGTMTPAITYLVLSNNTMLARGNNAIFEEQQPCCYCYYSGTITIGQRRATSDQSTISDK